MTDEDQYLVVDQEAESLFRDRGSKFLGFVRPVRNEEEVYESLAQIRDWHPKCNHHCYAYRLGEGRDRYRANDDGEPGGSAGRPILGQIDSRGLSDTLVVVARYFGGTKLGVPGLINAYKTAASEALDLAPTVYRQLTTAIELRFDYSHMSEVMNALSRLQLDMAGQDFGATAYIRLELPRSQAHDVARQLKAYIAGRYLEEVDEDFEVESVEIVVLESK